MNPGVDIVVVDDHAVVRHGLRLVLEREPDLRVIGESGGGQDALDVVAATRPDVVLLDLKLSPTSDTEGLELCGRLHRAHPDLGILVLTSLLEERLVVQAIHNGATGYVVKDVDTSELVRAIRAVQRGESAFDSRSAAAMVRSMSQATPGGGRARALTERELEVLRLLARGHSNREIARRLFVSETTVKFHVGNLMRKMEVSRRAEAVYAASKRGLI
ncbi:MadR family response regulator transcription factor [Aquipuribacter sp. MA13-6]|uniref:MadR family response regulator transcription factor n=1 Tax=unclassified Aquipuribacter TaxID=2635084 RepID=UPI003EEC4713